MKRTAIIAASFMASLLVAGTPVNAHGDDQNANTDLTPQAVPGPDQSGNYAPAPYPPAPVDRASHLMGSKVMNPNGKVVGTVTDVVFDLPTGKVSYIVVKREHREHGSYAFAAIPSSAFMEAQDRKHLILNTDKIRLQTYQGNLPPGQHYSYAPPPAERHAGELREVIIAPATPAVTTPDAEQSEPASE